MRYRATQDPFKYEQPTPRFSEELFAPLHRERLARFGVSEPSEGDAVISSLKIVNRFPDGEGLLDTALDDLTRFCASAAIPISCDAKITLLIEKRDTGCRESYEITVSRGEVSLVASDTEGIRRGIYYLEDEMCRREGPYLPIGKISRRPFIKRRISRCHFAPPSHASSEGQENELMSDIDYYPDEYLARLARDGVNGLWIGAKLPELLPSSVIPEYGKDSKKRLDKLCAVVKKCRRYGIGVYLFSVEPASGYDNPSFELHTELHGQPGWGDYHLFCPSTDGCREYIRESMTALFSAVPELAGFINITTGECLSGCGSAMSLTCPRCKKKYGTLAATLAATEKMYADVLAEVAPCAEFISWTYSQRAWDREDLREACTLRDGGVVHMQNFEDVCRVNQLGRERLALDYWLSVTGPGEIMSDSLAINRPRGIRTYAKIQACTSHEISTVPYVPTPGILYDKFKAMREGGIEGVVMSWYFGSYPGLMSHAACELSFEPMLSDKDEFLRHLAGIYWGSEANTAALAYQKLEEGYRSYPVSQSFEWFGPMQDSPAVPLHLDPVDLPMPSTWLLDNPVGGDRIGECLLEGHTLEEAVTLTKAMMEKWDEGVAILDTLPDYSMYIRQEQKRVASAIGILFESGHNTLRFYMLRRLLGIGCGDPVSQILEIKTIVEREINNSRALAALCRADGRLGYHPEAHGYKFFEQKLLWRCDQLEGTLKAEITRAEQRILRGEPPIPFYRGDCDSRVVEIGSKVTFIPLPTDPSSDGTAKAADEEPRTELLITESEGTVELTFTLLDALDDSIYIKPEFRMFHPSAHIELKGGRLLCPEQKGFSFYGERIKRRIEALHVSYCAEQGRATYKLSFKRSDFGMEPDEPFRIDATRRGAHPEVLSLPDRMFDRLIFGTYSPDSFAMIIKHR